MVDVVLLTDGVEMMVNEGLAGQEEGAEWNAQEEELEDGSFTEVVEVGGCLVGVDLAEQGGEED